MADPLKQVDAEINSGSQDDPSVAFWRKEIELSHKREKNYQEQAERITKLYEGDKRDDNSFNILYSNTNILLPATYNQLPRPFVDRRYKDEDPLGKLSAKALERVLGALEDSGDAEYDGLDSLLEQAVLGALVPGRGLTKFKYEALITSTAASLDDQEVEDPDTGTDRDSGDEDDDAEFGPGKDALPTPNEKVEYETVCGADIDYDMVVFGYARRWVDMPWVGYIHYMEKADAVKSFGAKEAELLTYAPQEKTTEGWRKAKKDEDSQSEAANRGSLPVAVVYEIWNKRKKEVVFFAPSCKSRLLKEEEDPYGLSGFFPSPEPLRFLPKRSKLTPTPLYKLYEEQAKELNRLTQRINRILHALKVRGFYDGTVQGLKDLLSTDDNTLIPARNVAAMRDGQNLDSAIWFMPLDILVKVLQALYPARDECKNTIYEITGIADIMRGDTDPGETATAQNIKNTHGTIRLNYFRKQVQVYARDCLRIMGELASEHFSLETFDKVTGLPYALPQDIAKAHSTVNMLNRELMQMQQQANAQWRMQQQAQPQPTMAPPPPPAPANAGVGQSSPAGPSAQGPGPGAPPPASGPPSAPAGPPPVQPTPQMQQEMQEAQEVLAKPPWEQVVGLLRDNLQRYYRIDIETNSTIASDTAEDKQNIVEAMGVISQTMESLVPLAQNGMLPLPAAKAMLMSIVRRFQFGREVEDALSQIPDQLPAPPPPPGTPTPAEQQAVQAKAQLEIAETQAKGQNLQQEQTLAQAKFGFEQNRMQREDQLAASNHQLKMALISAKMQEIGVKQMGVQAETQADVIRSQADVAMTRMDVAGQKAKLEGDRAVAAAKKRNGNATK